MRIKIDSTQKLGQLVRAVRKEQGVRLDDTAGSVGVSENFLSKLERGGERIQLGKVMTVLNELGIALYADVTEAAALRFEHTGASSPDQKSRKCNSQ